MVGQRTYQAQDPVAGMGRGRGSFHHLQPTSLDALGVPTHDGSDEVYFGPEVVADGGVVPLTGGLADLPIGHRGHTVFGEQSFSGFQDAPARGV